MLCGVICTVGSNPTFSEFLRQIIGGFLVEYLTDNDINYCILTTSLIITVSLIIFLKTIDFIEFLKVGKMQKSNNQTGRKWTFFGFNSQFDYSLENLAA